MGKHFAAAVGVTCLVLATSTVYLALQNSQLKQARELVSTDVADSLSSEVLDVAFISPEERRKAISHESVTSELPDHAPKIRAPENNVQPDPALNAVRWEHDLSLKEMARLSGLPHEQVRESKLGALPMGDFSSSYADVLSELGLSSSDLKNIELTYTHLLSGQHADSTLAYEAALADGGDILEYGDSVYPVDADEWLEGYLQQTLSVEQLQSYRALREEKTAAAMKNAYHESLANISPSLSESQISSVVGTLSKELYFPPIEASGGITTDIRTEDLMRQRAELELAQQRIAAYSDGAEAAALTNYLNTQTELLDVLISTLEDESESY